MKREDAQQHWHCDQCDAYGSITDADKHVQDEHTLIPCLCGMELYLKSIAEHAALDCPERIILCRYCHTLMPAGPRSFSAKDLMMSGTPLTQHESECGSRTINCMKCQRPVAIKDVPLHMKMHEVHRQTRPPPFTVCRNTLCSGHADSRNNLQLCHICFGPFYVAEKDDDGKKQLTRLLHAYFHQLTQGCGRSGCRNRYCRSSSISDVDKNADANDLAVQALHLANAALDLNEQVFLCVLHERLAMTRQIADQLTSLGYDVVWCIKSLEETRGDAMYEEDDSSEEDDEVVNIRVKRSMQEKQQMWIDKATTWLLQHAPTQPK